MMKKFACVAALVLLTAVGATAVTTPSDQAVPQDVQQLTMAELEAALNLTPQVSIKLCPRDINCLDVWDPVICSNGQIYSNACYAFRACATGCVPYGGTAS